jgi:hypothetical protein
MKAVLIQKHKAPHKISLGAAKSIGEYPILGARFTRIAGSSHGMVFAYAMT